MVLDLTDEQIAHLRFALLWYDREMVRSDNRTSAAKVAAILRTIERRLEKQRAATEPIR